MYDLQTGVLSINCAGVSEAEKYKRAIVHLEKLRLPGLITLAKFYSYEG